MANRSNGLPNLSRPTHVDSADWSQLTAALSSHGFDSGVPLSSLQSSTPQSLGNDRQVELQWAEKAGKHAETYFKVLGITSDKKKLRLTAMDDQLYSDFRRSFPSMDILHIDDSLMKAEGKEKTKWRTFCAKFEKEEKINDYNFGTLLRLRSDGEYDEENTCVVPRIQFLVVEIARNREGLNDWVGKKKEAEKEKAEGVATNAKGTDTKDSK